jgi:negative regulator of genetic competence, sporulation and motility
MDDKKTKRKIIRLGTKRVPIHKLLHGKEIREAAKALEDFRLVFNEEEFMQGAKLTVRVESHSTEVTLIATRLETDEEMADRLEQMRLAAERKVEREKKRKLMEAEIKEKRAAEDRKAILEKIKIAAKHLKFTKDEIDDLFKQI